MDYKKDTKENDLLKDASRTSNLPGEAYPSIENKFFEVASKRAEKIITALYMVTDFIKDNEPIKGELRSVGLSLLGATHDITKNSVTLFKATLPEVTALVRKTISFLEVSATMSLISDMNYQILRNELMALAGNYESKFSNFGVRITDIIGKETLEKKDTEVLPQKEESLIESGVFYKGQLKDIFNKGQETFSKKTISVLTKKDTKISTAVKNSIVESTNSNERKNKIINILKIKGIANITEISVDIEGVSEKTIQRDLQSLIDKGVLERVGERRWSRYSLKA